MTLPGPSVPRPDRFSTDSSWTTEIGKVQPVLEEPGTGGPGTDGPESDGSGSVHDTDNNNRSKLKLLHV